MPPPALKTSRNNNRAFLPENASELTASPYDDPDALAWVELATESVPSDSATAASFWFTMDQYTRTLHWNRQFFHLDPISESHTDTDSINNARTTSGDKYVALRELVRKTPSPIGGGPHATAPSYVCHEWTMHYTSTTTAVDTTTTTNNKGVCVCIFSLVIPKAIIKPDNPFAMTYWPYFYPKARAIRYTYDPNTRLLTYSVVPLSSSARADDNNKDITTTTEMDIRGSRPLAEVLKYAGKSAKKELVTVRKRMRNYCPVTRASTYVKRVQHDVLLEEKKFRSKYNLLREKYARRWVDSWNDTEVTDPIKFVYEEMAIAAYLLALWEVERRQNTTSTMQTFLDAGCGNGFLTYLLIEEGHPGIGIDLARRKIWDRYPPNVREALRCEQIVPDEFAQRGNQFDWIIGNHSDELTPWLPIFTANAQPQPNINTNTDGDTINETQVLLELAPKLFVLPCCFFDFDARKLAFGNIRRTISVPNKGCQGKYDQYITWIARICKAVGFEVVHENLRIPSTKYRALICTKAVNPERMRPEVLKQLTGLATLDAKLTRG